MKLLYIRNYSISRIVRRKEGLHFEYNSAFTRDISPNINNGLRLEVTNDIINNVNLDYAIKQKEVYKDVLKSLGVSILNIDSDMLPDSCFIEDTMVINDDNVCITTPGAQSRRLEIDRVTDTIKKLNHFKIVNEMKNNNNATCDGGDVLFTGSEFFIGINNNRTNIEGLKSLSNTFPTFKMTPIDLKPFITKVLHLKSVLTMFGNNNILVGGDIGLVIGKKIEMLSPNKYQFLHVPDIGAANVIWLNDCLITRSIKEFPNSIDLIKDRVGKGKIIEVNMSELAKLDGALSCCSVLCNK